MICSTIIPTIGRASLSRAVKSVLQQDFDRDSFEVIVVNDSGTPLPYEDWMDSKQVRVLHTNRHNRSVARNTGAAVALGRYLHFLDDDDWILPGAFQQLQETSGNISAGWMYGGFELVNNAGELLQQFQPVEAGNCFIQMVASEWIPLQCSWIDSKAFFAVGGFDSLFSTSGQDIDLSRKIARYYEFARTPIVTARIRYGDAGSSTDYSSQIPNNRLSREKSLDLPGAFARMCSSARASTERAAYWQARIAYYYLASIGWNIKEKRLTKAASRIMYLLFALLAAGTDLLSPSFWEGIRKPHLNLVRKTMGLSSDKMYQNTVWRHS